MRNAKDLGVIMRWEPHEAHHFTKPYSKRSSKPAYLEDAQPPLSFNQPVKRRRKPAKKRGQETQGGK